jgi:ABC-type transport system involved in multi-copper enzyme maturation permease subunit
MGLLLIHTVVEIGIFFLFLMLGCRWIRKQKVAAVPHAEVGAAPKEERRTRLAFARLFPIPDFLNPVAAKDILLVLPRRRFLRIMYGLLAATLFGAGVWGLVESRSFMGSAEAEKVYDIMALVVIGTTCFITYLRASGIVVSEIEAGTMGLLVTAPLPVGRVMSGKLQAVVVNVGGLFGAFGLSLAIVFCVCHPGAIFHVVATLPAALLALVAGAAFYGSLGIRISAGAKTVRSAGTQAAVLCLLLYVAGIPMIAIGYETLTSHIGEDAVAFLGRTLSTVLFPVWQILTPGDLLPTGGSRWVWFLVGVGASLGLAQLVLQSAARVCARRMRG